MKLIDVAEFYSEHGGGVKTYIDQKLRYAKAMGVQAAIIAPGSENRKEVREDGIIFWVKAPPIPVDKNYHLFNNSDAIFEILDAEKPDVVEGSSPWLGGKAVGRWQGDAVKSFFVHQDPVSVYPQMIFEKILNEKTVDFLFGWFWRYFRNISNNYDTTVVTTQWLSDRLTQQKFTRPEVVPFGIDKDLFSMHHRDQDLRRKMLQDCGIDDPSAPLLISISRHHPEKHIGTMIKAIEKIGKDRPIGLYLIGDGPQRAWVEKKAADVKGIHVAGLIKDRHFIARALASSDAMLHCSGAETYGLVIAEAMCSGLPLIVPNRAGAYELSDPSYAEVHQVASSRSCVKAIEKLLDRPQELLRAAAFKAGQELRTPKDHFQHLFTHYEKLLMVNKPATYHSTDNAEIPLLRAGE